MWTLKFWKLAAERAVKSIAQAGIGLWLAGGQVFNAFEFNWWPAGVGVMLGAGLLSLATSLVSSGVGSKASPSLVSADD